MNNIKSHFEIHSRFRNGIFLLAIFLLILIVIYFFYPSFQKPETNFQELTVYQKQIDSLKELAKGEKAKYKQRPFNPNFITDYKGYTLGMSIDEIDRLFQYRKEGKWVNSITDFKKVTGVSDSLLSVISPLFKFPEWIKNSSNSISETKNKYSIRTFTQKSNLNEVTSKQLEELIKIPDFIAARIIKYRNDLGGFIDDLQLKDVRGLYDHQRNKILALYTVKNPEVVEKININKASVKELMKVPYFDFETALEIKDFINENNGVSSFKELGKIEGFSMEKIDRIALYLTLN